MRYGIDTPIGPLGRIGLRGVKWWRGNESREKLQVTAIAATTTMNFWTYFQKKSELAVVGDFISWGQGDADCFRPLTFDHVSLLRLLFLSFYFFISQVGPLVLCLFLCFILNLDVIYITFTTIRIRLVDTLLSKSQCKLLTGGDLTYPSGREGRGEGSRKSGTIWDATIQQTNFSLWCWLGYNCVHGIISLLL